MPSNNQLAEWMSRLPYEIRENAPLIYLAIPGSNNSMSFGITLDSKPVSYAGWLPRFFNYLRPKFTLKWFKTQTLHTRHQLDLGIRYFDFKVCNINYGSPSKNYYFTNTLESVSIFEPFLEMYLFLKKHPKEVIILDFREICDMTVSDHCMLQGYIRKSFGHMLLRPKNLKLRHITLNKLEALRRQVIVIYRNKLRHKDFWSEDSWRLSTPPTLAIENITRSIELSLTYRKCATGHVCRFVIRPSALFIADNIKKSMKLINQKVHEIMNEWISQQMPGRMKKGCQPRVNVISCDFVDLNGDEFCRTVINLNTFFLTKKRFRVKPFV